MIILYEPCYTAYIRCAFEAASNYYVANKKRLLNLLKPLWHIIPELNESGGQIKPVKQLPSLRRGDTMLFWMRADTHHNPGDGDPHHGGRVSKEKNTIRPQKDVLHYRSRTDFHPESRLMPAAWESSECSSIDIQNLKGFQ